LCRFSILPTAGRDRGRFGGGSGRRRDPLPSIAPAVHRDLGGSVVRRLLAAGVLALSLLAATGCEADRPAPREAPATAAPTSPLDSFAEADKTFAAITEATCDEVKPINEEGVAAFEAGVDELVRLAVEGDEAEVKAAEERLRATLAEWSTKLMELSGRPTGAADALYAGSETIDKIADPDDDTPVAEAKETLAHVGNKIRAACATNAHLRG
jgi:hypothetical protein